ncbi:MAG: hypothetical protein LBD29_11060 [Treponema sp.]|nr:hypothetical protein [Treponema sp.]
MGCSSLQTKNVYEGEGDSVLPLGELQVLQFLEQLLELPEAYNIQAYSRRVFSPVMVKTRLMTHSYYIITSIEIKEDFHTLSFFGTALRAYSKGMWGLDTYKDIDSYRKYQEGKNIWKVEPIKTSRPINVEKTARKIQDKIYNTSLTYYYQDHIKDKPNKDNCNTALYETMTLDPLE